jgi:predicted neuraminidase
MKMSFLRAEGKGSVSIVAETCPLFLDPPFVISRPGPEYGSATRRFQGIPSLARSQGGRLWAIWYGGQGMREDRFNYVMLATIDPDGDGPVRAFDPQLWMDPDGRLWAFWAQAIGHEGTIAGVWALTASNPDDEEPAWSAPRRLTNGVMIGKPLVLSSGEWVLPASTWRETDDSAKVVVSTDRGKTWRLRGACHVPESVRSFDEHMLVEREDGTLWMLVRTTYGIGESTSTDYGRTWSPLTPSAIQHATSRFFVRRLNSGKLLLVKHGPIHERTGRRDLTAFLSQDEGRTWYGSLLLDGRTGVSYPDGVQSPEGMIYIVYDYSRTLEREILMARFTETVVAQGRRASESAELRMLVNKATAAD